MRFPIRTALGLAVLLAGTQACAARSNTVATPRTDSRMLNYAEIQEARAQNMNTLYDLVSSRRSQWLRNRATGTPTRSSATEYSITVWLDGIRLGGVEQLRNIQLATVVEARYLTPSEAQAALGLNNLGGAISVTTRR